MNRRTTERWLRIAWFLYGLAVIVPLLWTDLEPADGDVIAVRAGDGIPAKLARNVASLYYDDSFYYLELARNVADGAGSTFDGRHPTNGYHPLWLLCLIPLAHLKSTPEGLLLAGFALQAMAAALTTALVYRIARLGFGRPASFLAVAAWVRIQHTYWMSWSGMEYGLQALVLTALVHAYLRATRYGGEPDSSKAFALGRLASLAFLARLDNLLLAVLIGVALACRCGRPAVRWRVLAWYAAPVVLSVVAYVGFNLWLFDHPWPVSGAVKGVWSADLLAADPTYQQQGWLAAKARYLLWPLTRLSGSFVSSLWLGAFGGALALIVASARRRESRHWALWPLAAFATLQYLAYAVVYHGGFSYQPWYFVAQPLVAVLLGAALADSIWNLADGAPKLRRWRSPVAAAVLLVVLVSTAINTERRREQQRRFVDEPLYAAAGWMRAHLPRDATVGAWNAGIPAFFADRTVINLDGLVNSWPFFLEHRFDLCGYFEREGIDYLVDVFDTENPFAGREDQLGDCLGELELIWTGPGYPDSTRRALAYRWAPGSNR